MLEYYEITLENYITNLNDFKRNYANLTLYHCVVPCTRTREIKKTP